MKHFAAALGFVLIAAPALAQAPPQPRVPFTATLSNTAPLTFGLTVEQAAAALNAPLKYIRGTPGNEVFAAPRWWQSASYFDRHDQVFLQFRNGRLAGWKGDWGNNCMWE